SVRLLPDLLSDLEFPPQYDRSTVNSTNVVDERLEASQNTMAMGNSAREGLKANLEPTAMGVAVLPVRQQGLDASRGATDFGEYFLYFSFFLVVSALLLTPLFFKLGIEQPIREIGTLQ